MTITLLFLVYMIVAAPMVLRLWRWNKLINERAKDLSGLKSNDDPPSVSVLIAVRNGAESISKLIEDLIEQDLPSERFEVIIVNDHSEDDTLELVRERIKGLSNFRVTSLLEKQGKKQALVVAAELASNDVLLFTDADVECGPRRISILVDHWRDQQPQLVLMPVHTIGKGILGTVQHEEQVALLGSAVGSALEGEPILANGANMAMDRNAFLKLAPYQDNMQMASGDDMFLLEKVREAGGSITFLLDSQVVVRTSAVSSWGAFIAQRARWSGKMHAVNIKGTRAIGRASILMPLLLASMFGFASAGAVKGLEAVYLLLALFVWVIPVVRSVNSVKRRLQWPVNSFSTIGSLLLFGIYAPIITLMSIFVKPRWKGRRI